MLDSILVTKFYIPPARADLVRRPGLIERLNAGLDRKLTLISAPAGFGKSTLACEWLELLRHSQQKERIRTSVGWLSLDGDDGDPTRFFSYLIRALQHAEGVGINFGQGALSMLQSPHPPPTQTVLISLLNELAEFPGKLLLVLDDYHLVESTAVDDSLAFLIEHSPPQFHLVILTRQDPHLSLSKYRASAQLTELRAADLRFTALEVSTFLNQVRTLNLSEQEIAELDNRTEGWIAGLQLAAISIAGHPEASERIKALTGGHHLVMDYLLEEVLTRQPEAIGQFLLQTSILDRLTGSLCDALTGQEDGQETLETLEKNNLFIVPLDAERRWFRYHHLFSDLLRKRLRKTQPEQAAVLHRTASEWLIQNDSHNEAIEHALKAGDFDTCAAILKERIDILWQHGEHDKLRKWVMVLPDAFLYTYPILGIIRAYYLHNIGENEAGESLLQKIETELGLEENREGDHPETQRFPPSESIDSAIIGKLFVVRALIHSFGGNIKETVDSANEAIALLPEEELVWRNLASFALGDAYSFVGDMAGSHRARVEAYRSCIAADNKYYIIIAGLKLATTLREQGELQSTLELCQDLIELAEEHGLTGNFYGLIKVLWAETLAELDSFEQGFQHALDGVQYAEGGANLAVLGYCYLYLMRILFSMGRLDEAQALIHKASRLEREATIAPWLVHQMAAWQARLWLESGDVERAAQWMEKRRQSLDEASRDRKDIGYFELQEYMVFARILLAQNQLDDAIQLLNRLEVVAEKHERMGRLIEALALHSLALESTGEMESALELLGRSLALGKPPGFVRVFVDEGPAMARLLYEALSENIETEYVQRLLACFGDSEPEKLLPKTAHTDQFGLIEALSDREIEVLELIAKGLTNQVIADRLVLSLHTVKAHTRNIYGKLDVHNRTQAVDRARTLGILSPL